MLKAQPYQYNILTVRRLPSLRPLHSQGSSARRLEMTLSWSAIAATTEDAVGVTADVFHEPVVLQSPVYSQFERPR